MIFHLSMAYYNLRRDSVRNADDLIDIIEKCKERITLLSRQVFEAFPDKVTELHYNMGVQRSRRG